MNRSQDQRRAELRGSEELVAPVVARGARRFDRAFAAALVAIGVAACRAPAPSDLERSAQALSLAPLAAPTVAVARPRPVLVVPLPPAAPVIACDQAVVQGPTTETCLAPGTAWVGHILIATATTTYCHFTWSGADGPQLSLLQTPERIVEADCPVVGLAGAAPKLDPGLWPGLAATFRTQIGATAWQPSAQAPEVTVAVLDSAVKTYEDAFDDDTFGHGRLVGRIIGELACPLDPFRDRQRDSCPLTIRNALAVPRVPDAAHTAGVVNAVIGGYFGTRGELGDAIASALHAWEDARLPDDRLILNLSLGWQANLPAALQSNVATEAVATLLERASCLGALAIAAAGNQADAVDPGPFLPAAWEGRAAPDTAGCLLRWPTMDVDASAAQPRPLAYAAAAVDQQDRPLLTAHLSGAPRLVADGLAAVVEDRRAPGYTQVLSGSSVAAAVASGVAAAVWESAGALAGPDVIELIYRSAVGLRTAPTSIKGQAPATTTTTTTTTTLCQSPPCRPQRRISLCAALAEVDNGIGVRAPSCIVVPGGAGSAPVVSFAGQSVVIAPPCPTCTPGPSPAPETPSVWPQPNGAACPSCIYLGASCGLFGGAGVMGEVDPSLVNSINGMVNRVNASTGLGQITSVAARVNRDGVVTDFGLGTALTPDLFWLQQPASAYRATIAFSINLGNVPGLPKVTTSPQDIPVICP